MNKRKIGKDMEEAASRYLMKAGYHILEMNYYTPKGEIDMVAEEGGYLVFIEVKYRKNTMHGYPEEAIDIHKQQRIKNAARYYMMKKRVSPDTSCRYDVVAILYDEIKVIVNAFE